MGRKSLRRSQLCGLLEKREIEKERGREREIEREREGEKERERESARERKSCVVARRGLCGPSNPGRNPKPTAWKVGVACRQDLMRNLGQFRTPFRAVLRLRARFAILAWTCLHHSSTFIPKIGIGD